MKPAVHVVTGRPGSGKSTLARLIADRPGCPLVARDELKAGYALARGASHAELPDDTNAKVSATFFATVELLLSSGITVVAEAAFQHKLWAARLEAWARMADVRVVVCEVDAVVARERCVRRAQADLRHVRFHGDAEIRAAVAGEPPGDYVAPQADAPTLSVETGDGYRPALEEVLTFLSRKR